MNTRSVNSAAGVILAALQQNRVPAGIALALESAGLLMTPETARELAELRDRVAELEALTAQATQFRVEVPDGSRTLVIRRSLRGAFAVVESEAQGRRRAWTRRGWRIAAVLADSDVFCWPDAATAVSEARQALAAEERVEESADKLTQMFAPTQVLSEEGEHYPHVHHSYRIPHDLPETGGAQ